MSQTIGSSHDFSVKYERGMVFIACALRHCARSSTGQRLDHALTALGYTLSRVLRGRHFTISQHFIYGLERSVSLIYITYIYHIYIYIGLICY